MVNYIYLSIGIAIGLIIIIIIGWFFLRWRKKRKAAKLLLDAKTGLPLEILNDFEEAERRMKENKNGNITPHQILWQIARERNRTDGSTGRTENTGIRRASSDDATGDSNLQRDRELSKARDIQVQSNTNTTKDKRKLKTNWADFG